MRYLPNTNVDAPHFHVSRTCLSGDSGRTSLPAIGEMTFICGSCNEAVNSSDRVASSSRVVNV